MGLCWPAKMQAAKCPLASAATSDDVGSDTSTVAITMR